MSFFNIHLEDETQARMNQFNYNWSSVCQKAIEAELLRLETEKKAQNEANKSNNNWVTKRLKPKTFDNNAVIQPYFDNHYSMKNEVKIMSNFYNDLVRNLGTSRLSCLNCQLSKLLNEECQVSILFPGKDWQKGNLKLDFQLYFKYAAPPSE